MERTYVFTLAIVGTGETEEEALTDAIESFTDQGGIWSDSIIETRDIDDDVCPEGKVEWAS